MASTTTQAKNIYTNVKTGKKNKYTYVYSDEATCKSKGNEYHFKLIDSGVDVMIYGCEEVVAGSGKHYFGMFYYSCPDDKCIFYY